jgi:hypothetical protein
MTAQTTDREILMALFDMVGALAEQATGKRLTVRVPVGDGDTLRVYGNPLSITWEDRDQKAQCDRPLEPPPTPVLALPLKRDN